jgi:hypothetical protein
MAAKKRFCVGDVAHCLILLKKAVSDGDVRNGAMHNLLKRSTHFSMLLLVKNWTGK